MASAKFIGFLPFLLTLILGFGIFVSGLGLFLDAWACG